MPECLPESQGNFGGFENGTITAMAKGQPRMGTHCGRHCPNTESLSQGRSSWVIFVAALRADQKDHQKVIWKEKCDGARVRRQTMGAMVCQR